MAADRSNYAFTHHLRQRFVQRSDKKFAHLDGCKEVECPLCLKLRAEIVQYVKDNLYNVNRELVRRVGEAEEDKSYLNNTGFMGWYYEKYGYDKRFEFLVHNDLLFVVVVEEGKKIIVTCVPSKTHLVGKRHLGRHKFNRLKKDENSAA